MNTKTMIEKLKEKNDFKKKLNKEQLEVYTKYMLSHKPEGNRILLYGSDDEIKKNFIYSYSLERYAQLPYYKNINNFWNNYENQTVVYSFITQVEELNDLDKLLEKWDSHFPFESSTSKFDTVAKRTIFPSIIDIVLCVSPSMGSPEEVKERFRKVEYTLINLD